MFISGDSAVIKRIKFHLKAISYSIKEINKPVTPFVGYSNNQNLGDEILFRIAQRYLSPVHVLDDYHTRGHYLSLFRRRSWLLGGGTLLFDTAVLRQCEQLIRMGLPFISFGTGSRPLPEDLVLRNRWKVVLNHATLLGVRGTYSEQFLNELGFGAEVIGDPGSIVNLDQAAPSPAEDYILLNLRMIPGRENPTSAYERLYEYDLSVLNMLKPIVTKLHQDGLRIKLYIASPFEMSQATIWRQSLPEVPIEQIVYQGSFEDFCALARGARLTITMRLHPAIFSAALGVPSLMLERRPKYHDALSVVSGQMELIEPLEAPLDYVLERAHDMANEPSARRQERFNNIRAVAVKQREYFERIRSLLK